MSLPVTMGTYQRGKSIKGILPAGQKALPILVQPSGPEIQLGPQPKGISRKANYTTPSWADTIVGTVREKTWSQSPKLKTSCPKVLETQASFSYYLPLF